MKNLWNTESAKPFLDNPLKLRVYSSQLLGQAPDLVLHGGGNTSVKASYTNLFGEEEAVLYVKGSGWDLATIEAEGFAPVRLDTLQRMAQLSELSDEDMVKAQRAAMLDPDAPTPSVEAILHAIIPFTFVDHTHADAIVTITNTVDGESRIRELYGDKVLVIPYVMPGFLLAKKVAEMTRDIDWSTLEGIVLMNHGVFTFHNDARASYDNMIDLVSRAETYLQQESTSEFATQTADCCDLETLARLRRAVSDTHGRAMIAVTDSSPAACGFSSLPNVAEIAFRGPLTPDHVIRTKRIPMLINQQPEVDIARYVENYRHYFAQNSSGLLQILTPEPKWGVWPGCGTVCFGRNVKEASIIQDIVRHTTRAIQQAEKLGGWHALSEREIFEVEYWELEQAKLKRSGKPPSMEGKIALVTGAASGIGRACVSALHQLGAAVAGIDIDDSITHLLNQPGMLGIQCDVTDNQSIQAAIATIVAHFGGLDILISNAGSFPSSLKIEDMDPGQWNQSLDINLTSHQRILQASTPFLKQGIDPAVIFIASKNVPAPGPGASAYSVAKAGLTQLARIASLELAQYHIRVNTLHPDAVFDTGIWTDDILKKRAEHYGLSVSQYKTKNLLKTEVRSSDVARMACAMAGKLFSKTTGSQVPIDGGNDRVI